MSDIVEITAKVPGRTKPQAPMHLSIADQFTWGELVVKAREFTGRIRNDKMAVAELALRASTLGWGGSRKGQKWDGKIHSHALDLFAKEIGIAKTTLWDWCQVKRMMERVSLPIDEGKLDLEAAKRVVKMVAADPTVDVELAYQDQVVETKQNCFLVNAIRQFRRFRQWAENESDLSRLPMAELKELKEIVLYLNQALARIRIVETTGK